jgi:hypothetical protein
MHVTCCWHLGWMQAQLPGMETHSIPRSYKLMDRFDLVCDVKHEFNSDNRRLYHPSMLLIEGNV